MRRIALINMPFAALQFPSLALAQLQRVTEDRFGPGVQVRVLYLNHDFGLYLGPLLYQQVAGSLAANMAGFGDWFFRGLAFPELEDNSGEYLQRFFPSRDEATRIRMEVLLAKRRTLGAFLDRLIARYGLLADDLVGFTSMFCQNLASFALARRLKARNPRVVTVMGGANCETSMGEAIARHVPEVDFVFSGPALVSFPTFVERWLAGDEQGCHGIRGLLSARNLRRTLLQGPADVGEELPIEHAIELDYEPFLTALEERFPGGDIAPVLTFETSRGCWWGERAHCTFCGLNGSSMRYRAMPADRVIAQFERLFAYWPRCRRFESVDNIMARTLVTDVLPRLAPPEGCTIFYEVKADLRGGELQVLARAGVTEVQPGIEALATSTLRLMDKGTTSLQNIVFLKHCLMFGISPAWNLLMGFPGETEDVYRKYAIDLPRLVHLPPPAGAYPVRFDRYSPYHTKAAEYHLDLHASDFYRFIYPFDEAVLEKLAYYFTDRRTDAPYQLALSRWIEPVRQQVGAWRRFWEGPDTERPRLALSSRAGRPTIRDSRRGTELEYEIEGSVADTLCHLDRPRRTESLAAAGPALDWLRERDLLFEDGGHCVSLVVVPMHEPARDPFPVDSPAAWT